MDKKETENQEETEVERLKPSDLIKDGERKTLTLTIKNVTREGLASIPVLYFVEEGYGPMVLSLRDEHVVVKCFGTRLKDWIGRKVKIGLEEFLFCREVTQVLRVLACM